MTLASTLAAAWSRIRSFLETVDQAADHDPLEEQRRWAAALEEHIASLEARMPHLADRAAGSLPET
jgi:hypothetical protein